MAEIAQQPFAAVVEIVDYDNLKETLNGGLESERILLTAVAADFIQRTDPEFWSKLSTKPMWKPLPSRMTIS